MAAAKKKKKKKGRGKKDSEYDAIVDRTAWHPYQHACGYESQQRVESIEAAFRSNLDGALTFHVKAEPHRDDAPEDDIPAYELTFRHDAPVLDVIARVREQEGIDESEALQLVYCNVTLDEGKTLGSYRALIDKERAQWMKPYAGVIWIAAEGHIQQAEEKFGGQQKHPGYYESASAATNIFHRRNSMKL
jgi:hypothetical protein